MYFLTYICNIPFIFHDEIRLAAQRNRYTALFQNELTLSAGVLLYNYLTIGNNEINYFWVIIRAESKS